MKLFGTSYKKGAKQFIFKNKNKTKMSNNSPYPSSPEWAQPKLTGPTIQSLTEKIGISLKELLKITKLTKTSERLQFMDYFVLLMFFAISVSIGVFLGWKQKKDIKKKEKLGIKDDTYLTGGRVMKGWPVALSCTASFMSAITILGTPVEIYNYGTMYYYSALTYFCVACIVAFIFLPVLYDLNLPNGYNYFKERFNSTLVEKIASLGFLMTNILYMGIVTYAPALALSALSDINLWTAAFITAATCTLYTFVGGLKAVIWVDVFQALTIMTGFLSIIIVGSADFGGISNVMKINDAGGRIFFDELRTHFTIRSSIWSVVIGGTFGVWGGIYTNQSMIQRYMSCKNIKEAQKSVFINVLGLWTIMILAGLCGHVAYSYSLFCDPTTAVEEESGSKFLEKSDQLIPYISLDKLKEIPGMTGLYAAGVYAGTLSSLAGGITSTASVILKNYIKPIMKNSLSEEKEARLSQILVIATGFLTFGVSYIASFLGDSVLVAGLSSLGTICGPCMGLFLLGFLCPMADATSALIAFLSGNGLSIFLFLGIIFDPPKQYELVKLHKETCMCNVNSTMVDNLFYIESLDGGISLEQPTDEAISTYPCLDTITLNQRGSEVPAPERSMLEKLWHVSYWHLGSSGCFTVIIVGYLVSVFRRNVLNINIKRAADRFLHPSLRIGTSQSEPDSQQEKMLSSPSELSPTGSLLDSSKKDAIL